MLRQLSCSKIHSADFGFCRLLSNSFCGPWISWTFSKFIPRTTDFADFFSGPQCLRGPRGLRNSPGRPTTAQSILEISLNLCDLDWKKICMLPWLTTIKSSLRSFQYKILNNILYLNDRPYKFKAIPSPLCSLCKLENESLTHLFCQCIETRKLWHQLQT